MYNNQMPSSTEAQQRYLQKRRQRARDYLGGVCASCESTDGLEFDHIDPSTKQEHVSEAIARHWSWARLVPELDKCQLLCRPCHIQKSVDNLDGRIVAHGGGMSGKKNCPCVPCKSRKSEYNRNYKARLVH